MEIFVSYLQDVWVCGKGRGAIVLEHQTFLFAIVTMPEVCHRDGLIRLKVS